MRLKLIRSDITFFFLAWVWVTPKDDNITQIHSQRRTSRSCVYVCVCELNNRATQEAPTLLMPLPILTDPVWASQHTAAFPRCFRGKANAYPAAWRRPKPAVEARLLPQLRVQASRALPKLPVRNSGSRSLRRRRAQRLGGGGEAFRCCADLPEPSRDCLVAETGPGGRLCKHQSKTYKKAKLR